MQPGDLLPLGITLVVVGVALAFGLQVLGDIRGDMTTGSAEYNATGDTLTGVQNFTSKLPLVATIIVAVVIIGLVVNFFGKSAK